MVARKMLGDGAQRASDGTFALGHKIGVGNRSLTRARRLTNRYFAESLFHELTAKHPKTQQARWTRIVRRAIVEAEQDGPLAVRFIYDVLCRFLGSPTMPIAWADLTEQARGARYPEITREMSDAEAARIYQDIIQRSNGLLTDDSDLDAELERKAAERHARMNDGPDLHPVVEVEPVEAVEEAEPVRYQYPDGGRRRGRYAGLAAKARAGKPKAHF